MAAAVASPLPSDSQQYAENLRKSLMEDLFEGEELAQNDEDDFDLDFGSGASGLQDLDKQIEEFQDHEVIKGILDQGRVLKEYAQDVDDRLRQVEMESIQDYIQESDNLVSLHDQIRNCDDILAHMEEMLGRFQGDLGKVSDEIRALQVQSQTMSTKLRNRKATESRLGGFVEQVAISEEMITGVLESEVNEDYLEYLLALDRKLRFVTEDDVARSSQARRDVEPALERLRVKALTKVREFLMSKLYQLKRPKTNIQIIQQNVLLKYKYFVRFLREHGKDIYDELRTEYVGVLSRILAAHFKTYLGSMEKMQLAVAGPTDVIGAPDAAGGAAGASAAVLSLFGKQQGKATSEAIFELRERASVLAQSDKSAIIPHMAEHEGKRFPYEVIFRNVHKLLMDTATSEFFFCLDFFEDDAVFRDLFAPIIQVVESNLATALQDLHDIICIMLMIRINHEHRKIMTKRRVPCLDDYLDRLHLLLWPRFKVLFDTQLSSIRAGNERQLYTGECAVHGVTKRYAALAASMLSMMADHDTEDGVFKASSFTDMLDRMWAAIFDMLLRMSNMFKDRRQGIIFLILNYNYTMKVFRSADHQQEQQRQEQQQQQLQQQSQSAGGGGGGAAGGAALSTQQRSPGSPTSAGGNLGKAGATAIRECQDQLSNCTGLYVEDQLSVQFKDLAEFVKKAEQTQKRLAVPEGAQIPGFGPPQAAPVLRDFAARWTQAIELMNREVLKHFANDSVCGRDVLQASMTQLLLYYTRFLELLKKQGPEGLTLARDAVNIPSIMYEIKRITKT